MSIENLPQEPEDIVDLVAKAGYLKVENELGSIQLKSHDTIEIQPNETIFGARIKANDDGTITPTLTFDTKKLREPKKKINAEQIVDQALEEFFND